MFHSKHIHFIGIGGIGISALAFWALREGKQVSGSDVADSALLQDLRQAGATIYLGQNEDNLKGGTDLVLYTEAIDPQTNPEYLKAKELGVPVLSYFQALGEFSRGKKTVVVTGSHGKTTTTAMLGLGLIAAGLDPTVIVGSKVREFGHRNIRIGSSDLLVAEACEYRRSFLNFSPFGMVALNAEADHLDYYKDQADYVSAFEALARKVPPEGFLVANGDDHHLDAVAKACQGRVIRITQTEAQKADFRLQVFGPFNQLNALHALKAAEALGADAAKVKKALADFKGTWRRMELKGSFQGGAVYDDYGHHPTEVRSTLAALKAAFPEKRLTCVFQPHQYSRTYQLLEEFKTAFGAADTVIIPNIYAARDSEEDRRRIDAERLAKAVGEHHSRVYWGKDLETTFGMLKDMLTKDDIVVTMGAGDITRLAERLVSRN